MINHYLRLALIFFKFFIIFFFCVLENKFTIYVIHVYHLLTENEAIYCTGYGLVLQTTSTLRADYVNICSYNYKRETKTKESQHGDSNRHEFDNSMFKLRYKTVYSPLAKIL